MDVFFKQSDDGMVKEALLSQLALAVKEIQADVKAIENNSDTSASSLSTVLEAIFIHGLKETLMNKMSQAIVTDFGQRPDPNFWAPLLIFSHRDVIRQISSLPQVSTDVGRGRAWLRLALNEGLLSSYLYSMAADNSSLKPYYSNNAFLRDSEKLDLAKQLIEGVETCSFCFACNSSLLNVWTNMPLLMAGISTAILRSCPISSGTDVAQALTLEEASSNELNDSASAISVSSYKDRFKSSKLMVDEEEALKIILGTPVNESPLHFKMNSEQLDEEVAVDLAHEFDVEEHIVSKNSVGTNTSDNACQNEISGLNIEAKGEESTTNSFKRIDSPKQNYNEIPGVKIPNSSSSVTPHQSYDSLLKSYNNVAGSNIKSPNLKDVMKQFKQPSETDENNEVITPPSCYQENDDPEMISSVNSGCDFEVVPFSSSTISNIIPEYSSLIQHLTNLLREQGLDAQNYSCAYCKNPIGVNLENVRVCGFTGQYYCKDCYGCPEDEWIIPSRVLHNWDFRRYSISERAEKFLQEIQDHPLLDMKAINPRLYVVADEMSMLQNLRMQLNLLRAYLFTCRQPVGEDLKKQIWPKEYLYEHLHLYSVSDLMKIPNGGLIQLLEKAVTFSRLHVLSCSLCKLKGFICEICSAQKVIYPFDLDSTYKCRLCNGVYHSECLNRNKPCPKCKRQKERRQQDED